MSISPKALAFIDAARKVGEVYTHEELLAIIEAGEWQVWERDDCAIVSSVVDHEVGKVMELVFVGGDMESLLLLEKEIAAHAKSLGCVYIYANGRPGWQRVMKDYTVHSVTIRRPL